MVKKTVEWGFTAQHETYNNRWYYPVATAFSKANAKKYADKLRKKGYRVRTKKIKNPILNRTEYTIYRSVGKK